MNKKLLLFILVILTAACFLACTADENALMAAETVAEIADEDVKIVELKNGDGYAKSGDYEIRDFHADILDDRSRADGWYYDYCKGTESGVASKEWKTGKGMYTTCELFFNMTSMKERKSPFSKRFTGYIVFDAPEDFDIREVLRTGSIETSGESKTEIFPFTFLQTNPDQTDAEGREVRSKDAVALGAWESADQWLFADVSERFLRSWSNETPESMWAYFTFNDGIIYSCNLHACMLSVEDN